ncbi:tumor suppressing sub-chromosomal transferable candidate 4 [Trinorchestia longiramus]|nr:tumor suppressing sub-chromosomal transferable candidate 4 [Trinorchestia longiramus]
MSFKLSSSDCDFNSRVNDLFSCLNSVETTLPEDGLVFESSTSGLFQRDKHGTLSSGSQSFDGNFKRPNQSNIPQRKKLKNVGGSTNTPDYELHPESWTCYSMRDTKLLNDEQNKKACLQLLSDLKQNKAALENEDKFDECKDKIVFKKPSQKSGNLSDASDTRDEIQEVRSSAVASDVGGTKKFVMEEHVVGVSKKKKRSDKSRKSRTDSVQDKVTLSYLKFDDDNEDEIE